MLLRCIRAESRKLHASPVWLMFLLLPTLSAGYGTFNYLQNLDILSEGWYSLWTQHTLFYSLLFFPALVAVYAAYLWRRPSCCCPCWCGALPHRCSGR